MNSFREPLPNNQLLAALPPEAADAVRSRVESVDLEAGATLYEAGTTIRYVHFPVTAVVSLYASLQDGAGAELAVVGHEGVVGVCAFMDTNPSLSSAVVLQAGTAWRMKAHDIRELARDVEPVMQELLRYAKVLFTHMAQKSVCHTRHGLTAQLCCWLLQHLDRQVGNELRATQERIAEMLGVRREGVTAAALDLQRQGLIDYHRGRIQVLDRHGLEQASCECYRVVDEAYASLGGCGWTLPRGDDAAPQASADRPAVPQLQAAEAPDPGGRNSPDTRAEPAPAPR